MEVASDAQKGSNDELNQERLKEGYVYFENANLQIKKGRQMELLMQLLNPTFSKQVKVYHDPMAKQTT
jgi:nitrate reductase beta subunit